MTDRIADLPGFTPTDEDLELPTAEPIVEQLVGNPADPEAPPAGEAPAPPPAPLDPFDIAGNALAIATNAFNALAGIARSPQTNAILKAAAVDFDRATALAEAASSFGHALVARDQLIIMRRQVAEAEAAKREVIITPGALPKLNRI